MLNEKALNTIMSLSEPDAAYCAKLAQRFAAMGIADDQASSAICGLVEADAIPEAGVTKWAGSPKPAKAAQPVALDELSYA